MRLPGGAEAHRVLRGLRTRLRALVAPLPVTGHGPPVPDAGFAGWLASSFQGVTSIGRVELAALEDRYGTLAQDADRLSAAKAILDYFAANSAKTGLLCGSQHHLQPHARGIAVRLAFIAGNYVVGQSARALGVAEAVSVDWPGPLTKIRPQNPTKVDGAGSTTAKPFGCTCSTASAWSATESGPKR